MMRVLRDFSHGIYGARILQWLGTALLVLTRYTGASRRHFAQAERRLDHPGPLSSY